MQYYNFEHIFDEYNNQKKDDEKQENDIGKVRDKFTEIVKLVGIDISLLRKYKDKETGEMVSFDNSNRQFCFPETICDFCIEMIKQYTSSDFKKLRKMQYEDVAIEELNFLVNGFTQYLSDLGYDLITILKEKKKMEEHLHYNTSVVLNSLYQECKGLLNDTENYNNSTMEVLYEDKVCFTWYVVEKMKKLREYISSIYGNYVDIRSNDLDHFAIKESSNVSTEDVHRTLILGDALKHDKEYQTLLQKQMDIISTPDFAKNLDTSYKKNNEQLRDIKELYERKLFGDDPQESSQICNFTPANPLCVLREAIQNTDETELARREHRERIANIGMDALAELLKLYGPSLDLPDTIHLAQKIIKKGTIKFPCCTKEEIIVYEGTTGCVVNNCPRCGKPVFFNFDEMTAEIYKMPKGHMEL